MIGLLTTGFYRLRKDEINKHLLTWKISLQVLKEKPITGVGIGNFRKAFGDAQTTYFEQGEPTEQEVALELEFFMRSLGAESTSFPTIAVSGSASALPHGVPRPVKLEKGFFTMDYGCIYKGYCSDMTRTVVIGKADEDMKLLYNTVLKAQTEAEAAIREGITGAELDKIARDIIGSTKYKGCFGHSLGHGVGMYIHEAPGVSGGNQNGLQKGHVITIEPGIYVKGTYGCRIEDMAALRETGVEILTRCPKELIEL